MSQSQDDDYFDIEGGSMAIEQEMEALKQELILMARKAESIFYTSLQALETRDESLIAEVRREDAELDKMELSLDKRCMLLLELKGPYAVDFRYVYSVIKTNKDLERVGDESKTIAKWTARMKGHPDQMVLDLAAKSKEALRTAIQALVDNDPEMARKVMPLENEVDEIEDAIMENSPNLAMGFIAKALERVSDMATNVAENIIFSVEAQDIRHGNYPGKK